VLRLTDLLAAAVAPDRCLDCGAAARSGALLCDDCRRGLPWLPVDGCPRCGLPERCRSGRCPARGAAFAAAWAPLAYEGPARALALAGKERAARRVARWLGAAMVARAPSALLAGVEVVVPAAADPVRRRRRGEDHALLIAEAVGRGLGLPVRRLLARATAGPAQHHRDRAGRLTLVAPLVVARPPTTVLLVDDVHTTGATLRAAAEALRAAGAERVAALTGLRTLG
jgi:predicted amidophosphoribosyltransferase